MLHGQALRARVKDFALAQGANLVGIALPETYADYSAEVERRIAETGATHRDFMIADGDAAFFDRLVSAANSLPSVKAVLIIGVYAYDDAAVYRHTSHKLLGSLERFPRLLDLLGGDRPTALRRNAAIALVNIGHGRADVLAALEAQVAGADEELRNVLRWAIERLTLG